MPYCLFVIWIESNIEEVKEVKKPMEFLEELSSKPEAPPVHDTADDKAWHHVRHRHGGQADAQPVGLVLRHAEALEVLPQGGEDDGVLQSGEEHEDVDHEEAALALGEHSVRIS